MATKPKTTESNKKQEKKEEKKIIKPIDKSISQPAIDFESDAGAGFENMGKDDFSVPRLCILQALSPQVTKGEEAFIPGAAAGNFCIASIEQVFDEEQGVSLIPVSYRRTYIEFKTRKQGGGFVRDHGPASDILTKCRRNEDTGEQVTPEGTIIVTVSEYFMFMLDADGGYTPILISMKGAQMKHARQLNTKLNNLKIAGAGGSRFTPPMSYSVLTAKTKPESNEKGNWFGWDIEITGNVTEIENGAEIYAAAKEFRKQIDAGKIKPAAEEYQQEPDDIAAASNSGSM